MLRHARLLFAAALIVVGCGDGEVVSPPENLTPVPSASDPVVRFEPSLVDFGEVEVGEQSSEVFRIHNEGDSTFTILEARVGDPGAGFDVMLPGAIELAASGFADIVVTYRPNKVAEVAGSLDLVLFDEVPHLVSLDLVGSGTGPLLELSPRDLDFGLVDYGCTESMPVSITNVGVTNLEVRALHFDGAPEFAFDSNIAENGELPWTLSPNEAADVWIDFSPESEEPLYAFLSVESSDVQSPVALGTVLGVGGLNGTVTEVFEQVDGMKADIIWAMDLRGSMSDDSSKFLNALPWFVQAMVDGGLDYQLALVVQDSGCIASVPPYVSGEMDVEEQLEALQLQTYSVTEGSLPERHLALLNEAVSEANLAESGCNDGLVREGAKLNLVAFNDEPDQSAEPVDYFVSRFLSLKENPEKVALHTVSAINPSVATNTCGANYDSRYSEVAAATGGVHLDICEANMETNLAALIEEFTRDPSRFFLSQAGELGTHRVRVDGIEVFDWSLDEEQNAIVFGEGAVPEVMSTIKVTYANPSQCERG